MPDTSAPKPQGGKSEKPHVKKRSRPRGMYWTLILGGLAIVVAGWLLSRSLSHLNFGQPGTAVGGGPVVVPKKPPNPSTLSYHAKNGEPPFDQIKSADQFYQEAAARWIAFRFRGVSNRGANAGQISLKALRLASGIVPLPKSMAAAGVHLPPGTPPDGSVQGVSNALIQSLIQGARAQGTTISSSQAKALLNAVGSADLAIESNNPLSFLSYLDGVSSTGSSTLLAQSAVDHQGPLMKHMVGVDAGVLPNAVHYYYRWAVLPSSLQVSWVKPSSIAGQSVVAEVRMSNPAAVRAIATAQHGGVLADVTAKPLKEATLALIQNKGTFHWYIVQYQMVAAPEHVSKVIANALDGQAR